MAKHRRTRIAEGIYRDRGALAATVKVGSGPTALTAERRYEIGTSLRQIQDWRRIEREKLEKLRPRAAGRGTFDADIQQYLLTLTDRPALQATRALHLAWWANYQPVLDGRRGDRLGARRRYTFTKAELAAALAEFASTPFVRWPGHPEQFPSPTTVAHYRTALFSLYTTLDGKDAPNPLREVERPRAPDPEPRAIPYEVIEAIFAAMPERGRGIRDQKRGTRSLTKARLRVMAYVGLPPAQIAKLLPGHFDEAGASLLVQGRKKGQGARARRVPLMPQGVAAVRDLFALGANTAFSTSSARQCWWRAIHKMVDDLALTDWRAARAALESLTELGARPYDLRHSYLTQSYLVSGDQKATAGLGLHADMRMTDRYTLAAVDPRLRAVAALLAVQLPAAVPSGVPSGPMRHRATNNDSLNNLKQRPRRRSALKAGLKTSKTA